MEISCGGRPASFLGASSTGYLFEGRGMKKVQRKVALYDANEVRDIPMGRLLDILGVRHGRGGFLKCPFPEHHKNGDANPSAKVFLAKNKLHCFVSGESWSTIDLIKELKGLPTGDAIKWLGETFHLREKESRISFKGQGKGGLPAMKRRIVDTSRKKKPTIIQQILDSPGYPALKPATVKVGLALLSQMPEKEPVVKLSQRELKGMTGYGDFAPIKTAIEELQSIGILAVQKHGNRRTTFRATPLDPVFKQWVETGIREAPAHGNPVQNTGTVSSLNNRGSGGSLSTDELKNWCAEADRVMKDFFASPGEFFDSLKHSPELETLRGWLKGKPGDLTLHAVRIFARTERRKTTDDPCKRFVYRRNHYFKLAKETPPTPAYEPMRDLPKAPTGGHFLKWLDDAAEILKEYGMRFENTLTREEQDILRQWIGAHTWLFTITAFRQLAEEAGKDCPDPCRLYFERRDHYYEQAVSHHNA